MIHWKRVTRWLSTPPYDQEIAAYCQQFGFSRAHSALAACERLIAGLNLLRTFLERSDLRALPPRLESAPAASVRGEV
jgi:hypothetical protein